VIYVTVFLQLETVAAAGLFRYNRGQDHKFGGASMTVLNKEMKEICLLDQVYVKAEDGKQSVAKYLDEVGKANGTTITLKKFVRFETGEGLEKKNEDFAAEVAAQMNA